MFTSVTVIDLKAVYVDYLPSQPHGDFPSSQSAAAYEQGLLTSAQAMTASWQSAVRPKPASPIWR